MRLETSDKNTTQNSSRKKIKRKAQVCVIHCPAKRRSKNSQKNPPDRKIGFMYKRTEKKSKEQKKKIFI